MLIVNDKDTEWRSGMTVADLLFEWGESGRRTAAIITVGGCLIHRKNWNRQILIDGDEIRILPMARGG